MGKWYYYCTKHQKYKFHRQPRTACPGCWWLWFMLGDASDGDEHSGLVRLKENNG
jgi:hypothetical protein